MAGRSNVDQNEEIDRDEKFLYNSRPWLGVRTVVVPKVDDSLDFTFRHLAVQPHDQSDSVDSTLNGDETGEPETVQFQAVEKSTCSSLPMETIFVKQVKQDSKAHDAGLRTGDRIVSINGVSVAGKTYAQVIRLIHGSDSALTLMVIPKDDDVLQMAYRTASGDDRGTEIPNQISSQTSTCVVSLSPASTRRGERRSNHEPVAFSSSPEKVKCHQHRGRTSSSSPSLRINVRISTSTGRGTGRTASEMVNPVGFNSNEKHLSGGSSFYPVTTISRKIKPEDSFSPQERYFLETDFSSPSERHGPLRANEPRQDSTNSYSSQGDRGALSGAGEELRQSAVAYSLTSRHSEVDGGHRRFPKMTSYQEITLAKLSNAGTNALAPPHSSMVTAQPRASSQEAYCSSSHFIQLGTAMLPPGPLVPVSSQLPQQSGVSSSLIGPRHQMFVSARPQSYESLFGRSQLSQNPDANPALTGGASRSSSELVESSSFARAMQSSAAVSPNPPTTAEQPRINLVSERMKRFETVDANSTEGVRHLRALKPWVDESVAKGSCPQFGFDSVAKRAAHFEQISSEDACRRATEPLVTQGKRSEPSKTYRAGGTGEPRELWSSAPSPSSASSKQVPQSVTIPLYFRADPLSSSLRLTSPALRRHDAVSQNYASDGAVAEALASYDASSLEKKTAAHSSDLLPSPKLPARQLSSSYQEKSERAAADGSCSVTVESFSQSTTLAMAATLGIRDQLFTGDSTDSPSSSNAANVSGKSGNSNIKKFVAFFTDKSPKTVDLGTDKKSSSEPLTSGNIAYEGCLVCKAAVAEGKKASDRSWKQFWAVLKGHFLCLYKDRYSTTSEDQSLCIKSCSVEIASDYMKKRNVFQVTTASGSKFLFQAEDTESMSSWVKAIQSNSELKEVKETDTALGQNLHRNLPVEKTSPQVAPKTKKQPSRTMPTSKSPASPLSKSRRSGVFDKDAVETPRSKEHKTWKGKVVSKFVRNRSGSGPAMETPDDQEVTGTFGVPLCDCPPSLFNEYVPLIVETCTKIVEERGIENQGIYRVPGNNCAVNTLRDELNKFPENIDADSEKLQDVNVVSSLLKLFFRKLPDSLVTDDLYESVIAAYRLPNPEKKMLKLKKLLHELPEHNFETFRFLAQHLNRVASREELNKMDARNLAIVFGPTLVRPQDESVALMIKDMSDQCRVVETIIINVDWFFGSWDEDVNVPVAEENEPISSMDPELLAKAENRINPTEMMRDTSAKDLVSSIFHPRKRIRRKEKHKNAESIETEGESDVSFTDRTVDQDLDIQGLKVMLESGVGAGTSSFTVSSAPASATLDPLFPADVADIREQTEAPAGSADAAEQTDTTAGSEVEVKRYPAYQFGPVAPAAETENSKPKILRRYSEDAFGRSARVEPGGAALRPLARDGSLVENAQQQLRRLHLDTKALHHKQELERAEREKRSVAKERIEREINKTLQELEFEENESSPSESPQLSNDPAAIAGSDGGSVRSAMDRCKLALYENRLRFFTDFGEKKPSGPLFKQGGGGTQSGISSTVSPAPLTRRLSDQPGDLLRAKDDCLLRAAPVRAQSVSPSIIGREQKYTFERPYVNSDTVGSTCDSSSSSSSFQRLDRSLAAVFETPSSSTNVTCVQLCASSQPLIFSSSKLSDKDFSTSSAGSLTVSILAESSTARSSLASSGDHSAKDSVFSEKSPTESEPNMPASADSGFMQEIMTSGIQDLGIQCEGKSMRALADTIPGLDPDVTSVTEGLDIVGSQEKISLHSDNSLSNKEEAVSTASFMKESLSKTGLDIFIEVPHASEVDMPSSDILKDDSVGLLEETAIPADFKISEENSAFAEVVKESCLVSLPETNQLDHEAGSSEVVDMARGDGTVVAVDSSPVICSSVGENLDLSARTSLTGDRKFCLRATDFTESTPVSASVTTDDILLNCSLPLKPENSFNVEREPTGDGNASEKTCENTVSIGREVNPSRLISSEEVTLCEVTGTPAPGAETCGSAAQHGGVLLPTSVKSAANLPSFAPAPTSCHRFTTRVSNFIAKKLQRRHSIGSGPLQGLPWEPATRRLPGEPSSGRFESRDLSRIHPAASLPLLPNP